MSIVARGGGGGTTNGGQTQATGPVATEMKAHRYLLLLPVLARPALPMNLFIRPTEAPVPQQVQVEKEKVGIFETETFETAETPEISETTEISGISEIPEIPEISETPETVEISEIPETPETPETPEMVEMVEMGPTDTTFTGTATSLNQEVEAVQEAIETLAGVVPVALVLAKPTHIMAGIAKSSSTMEAATVGKNFTTVNAKNPIATITGIVSETENVRKLTEGQRSHTTATNRTLAVAAAAVQKCHHTIETHATKQMGCTTPVIATNLCPALPAHGQINHIMQGSVINRILLRAQVCVATRRPTTKHEISAVNQTVSVQ